MSLCDADSNCWAVECGGDYCSWWKNGVCGVSESDSTYHTCRSTVGSAQEESVGKYLSADLVDEISMMDYEVLTKALACVGLFSIIWYAYRYFTIVDKYTEIRAGVSEEI